VKAGAKKTAYLGINDSAYSEVILRKNGFIDEAEAQGIEYVIYEEHSEVYNDDKYFENFFKIKEHQNVDGIFANTDLLAAKYIDKAKQRGIRVPEEVKVIGYVSPGAINNTTACRRNGQNVSKASLKKD
jgi:LacI family transcriptional regulator